MLKISKQGLKFGAACVISVLLAKPVYAAKMASSCSMSEDKLDISGTNIDTLMPIASVSKIYTSLMAVTNFNVEDKFYTQIYVTKVSQGLFDVHIQGSHDPYFNKFKMHMIISKLNEMKVINIRNLTFDENVKYLHETDLRQGFRVKNFTVQPLTLKADLDFPPPQIVGTEFTQLNQILKTYKDSYKLAAANGITLFKNPNLHIQRILFLNKSDFKAEPTAQKIFVASQNIRTILKSINWNSNNFAANQMFMASGGPARFNKLYYRDFNQTENDVVFVNGSGQNHDLTGNGRIYNKATCRNVLRTLHMLNRATQSQKINLQDIMSVVGTDKGSTVGGAVYSNELTNGAVIAKTGTIGTNIALAGLANTQKGKKYFMFNVELKSSNSNQEANNARRMISMELQKLIKANGGPVTLNYHGQNPLNDNLENYDEDTIESAH
jgi:D-alanyl-D-alanine carboxypeptidase